MNKDELIDVKAREILDSRGVPTVEVEVRLKSGALARADVPAGVSTGSSEAVDLRDGGKRYLGKGVLKAVDNVNEKIRPVLLGRDSKDQKGVDQLMIELDGSDNKRVLGANAILGVSMAVCRAASMSLGLPLYRYIGRIFGLEDFDLPQPQILMLEGGKHGNWSTDCQEYFVIPKRERFESFTEMLRVGAEAFQVLREILNEKGYSVGVGFEGVYMPREIKSNEEAFELMVEAIKRAGYKPDDEVLLGVDGAASEFFEDGSYVLKSEEGVKLSSRDWTNRVLGWLKKYPIWSIEDMHSEEDWQEWSHLTAEVGGKVQVVGDDLLTTNVLRIEKAIKNKSCNSVLIKLNQVGTVTETLAAIKLADKAGLTTVVSHRGGETNDDMIADLVMGTSSWQSKFGGPNRGERVAKYNRLLRIEEELKRK